MFWGVLFCINSADLSPICFPKSICYARSLMYKDVELHIKVQCSSAHCGNIDHMHLVGIFFSFSLRVDII